VTDLDHIREESIFENLRDVVIIFEKRLKRILICKNYINNAGIYKCIS